MNIIHKFTVEKDGKIYDCIREVSGIILQTQTIQVIGRGKRPDPSSYGKKMQSTNTMELVAKMIAAQIIAA